jgi:sugar phosphate isomerase/epimerase
MVLTRRAMLAGCAGAIPAVSLLPARAAEPEHEDAQPLGVVIDSFSVRRAASRGRDAAERFDEPLVFLEHCHALGARGIQVGIGARDDAYAARLKGRCEAWGMYLEGTIRLPRDRPDVERFEAEVRTAKQAGASLLRTVMLVGRRYEVFASSEAFDRFAGDSYRSLTLAEPVVSRHRMRLAVENHKDWLAEQLAAILKRLGSERVGVCLDTGNNVALLEDPTDVVRTLAPLAFTTHLKDMAVREYGAGFLLAEVPLGQGFLDLPRIVGVLRAARPDIHFNLEMITRDPLKIPYLTTKYWATFDDRPGRDVARMVALVREHAWKRPLPEVSGLSPEERLEAEDDNIRRSLSYARERLGVS